MGIQTLFVLHSLILLPLLFPLLMLLILVILLLPLPLLLLSNLVLHLFLLLLLLFLILLTTTIIIIHILTQPITNLNFARSIFNPYDTQHTLLKLMIWLYPLILLIYLLRTPHGYVEALPFWSVNLPMSLIHLATLSFPLNAPPSS